MTSAVIASVAEKLQTLAGVTDFTQLLGSLSPRFRVVRGSIPKSTTRAEKSTPPAYSPSISLLPPCTNQYNQDTRAFMSEPLASVVPTADEAPDGANGFEAEAGDVVEVGKEAEAENGAIGGEESDDYDDVDDEVGNLVLGQLPS